ncbi:hypothetical protein [Nocardioides pelophilus]|uniref:hypothetical protein n=1 Tax=Nocardioides pelophilus TaxID=2172019 RepID=UPI001600027A|nr:hypothetical protein [Nocardioides pelophilus]
MNKIARIASVAATAALTLGLAGPAHAERYGIDDPSDTPHGSDLLAVDIQNRDHKLIVVTTHDNLRRAPSTGSGGLVYIDTDPENRGPEFVFVAGFYRGTDYQLIETQGFSPEQWGEPVDGNYSMDVDYARDKVRFEISRPAISGADDVRIAIKVSGTRTDGTSRGTVDWLGSRRAFTPWIARG